ncbi:unnamed protein product [marine sediment metagenome]|uniref:Uncharacterized protein n=1 Tax=marine sediment metagenome TaxID=412755 RepID=X0Y877_9ZZZZ
MATLEELKMRKMELRDEMDEERRDGDGVIVETGTEYGQLVDRLQAGERKLYRRIKWPVLLLLSGILLFADGCLENTMREAGKLVQQSGRLVTGVGTDWTRGAEGYANEE